MTVPIYIDGRETGALDIQREGPVTVMRADLEDVGRVVRLTVFGEREGYLGVPEPVDGRLKLTRRLSPAQMRTFPKCPGYAAERAIEVNKERPPEPAHVSGSTKTEEPGRHVLWMGGKPHYF